MNPALASEIALLSDVGWKVVSQTESIVSLETRGPFSWWIFLFCLIFFPIVGSTIYILWWLVFGVHHLFARVENEGIVISGDMWLVDLQKANLDRARQYQREVKEKGFWRAAGPSIFGVVSAVVLWFILIWVFIQIVD